MSQWRPGKAPAAGPRVIRATGRSRMRRAAAAGPPGGSTFIPTRVRQRHSELRLSLAAFNLKFLISSSLSSYDDDGRMDSGDDFET